MAHHHHIHFHGEDVVHRVEQGFALAHAAAARGEIHRICAQTAFGQFKRNPGAGAAFKKQVSHRDIAQRRHFFDGPVDDFFEIIRRFEDEVDVIFGYVFDANQVAGGKSFHGRRWTGDGGRWTVDGRRETVDGRRWMGDGGWETVDGGRGTVCFLVRILYLYGYSP